jgi:hypothetical protein
VPYPSQPLTTLPSVLAHYLQDLAPDTGGVLLDYAIDGVALRSFDFWIALDNHGTVNTIRVEESQLVADSYVIYDVRPKLPVYEHPEFARMIEAQK